MKTYILTFTHLMPVCDKVPSKQLKRSPKGPLQTSTKPRVPNMLQGRLLQDDQGHCIIITRLLLIEHNNMLLFSPKLKKEIHRFQIIPLYTVNT